MSGILTDPQQTSSKAKFGLGLSLILNLGIAFVFALAAIFLIYHVNLNQRQQAMLEAEAKAQLTLDRNLAIHTYFSHDLKPTVFKLVDPVSQKTYFEPAWMSSTYAVREIDKYFKELEQEEYYYKECAINARSPVNEADEYEKSFIEELNRNHDLKYRSAIRQINDKFYFDVLRRGEAMEEGCLKCHSTPDQAPADLVKTYGPQRSFNRKNGEIVSAISIRVPLSLAYARADLFSKNLTAVFLLVLMALFITQYTIYRLVIINPIKRLHGKTRQIIDDEKHLGEPINLPYGRELAGLASDFNTMSDKLSFQMNNLEELVTLRTKELSTVNSSLHQEILDRQKAQSDKEKLIAELQKALAEIKTLQGIIPICSFCKKIRDDKGFWEQVDVYVHRHSHAEFSHGICPDCLKKKYPDIATGD